MSRRRFQNGDFVVVPQYGALDRLWHLRECLGRIVNYDLTPRPWLSGWGSRDRHTGRWPEDTIFMPTKRYEILWYPPMDQAWMLRRARNNWVQFDQFVTFETASAIEEAPDNVLNDPRFGYVIFTESVAPNVGTHDINRDGDAAPTLEFTYIR